MIHFNVPPFVGTEFKYMQEAVENHKICGDGPFTKKCNEWLENRFNANRVMLTTSGSTALDMAALLCGIKPGDEVILPSFTYQVVRKELFAHLRDPAIVIRKDSITFNTACITGLEDVGYVHVMFNNDLKRIVVRGCDENDKDALRWCINGSFDRKDSPRYRA